MYVCVFCFPLKGKIKVFRGCILDAIRLLSFSKSKLLKNLLIKVS